MTSTLWSPKTGALAALVLQNTFLVVFMHYSRTRDTTRLYASSTAVTTMEVVKLVTCLGVIATSDPRGLSVALQEEILRQPMELVKLAVPSVLYTIQNNLLYFALSHLDAATFQVGYQVKILTTAMFSVTMLRKQLTNYQWLALVILTIGVSLAQLADTQSAHSEHMNSAAGFLAVLLASCTSGFAGVYFEKILKNSGASLWMRNVQMGLSSVIIALAGVYFSGDWPLVATKGFFFGYNQIVIFVILLQAIGGLIVALVVKYADNILKGFAAAMSIVTACLLSFVYFDFRPSFQFLLGACMVIVSMYMYAQDEGKPKKEDHSSAPKPPIHRHVVPVTSGSGYDKV